MAYPHYLNHCQCQPTLKAIFQAKLNFLLCHFFRKVLIHVEHIQGILDSSKLYQKVGCFIETMWKQFCVLDNPLEYGAITRLWTTLGSS